MLKRTCIAAALALAAAITTGALVTAQEKRAPDKAKPSNEEVPHYRAKQLLGAKVQIEGDQSAGTVDDIVLDADGNVDYLIVVNSRKQLVTVPWDATRFDLEKRIATVQIAPEQFARVPTYTVEQYPAFATPAYRTQVYQYYGLTPGQQRRAMRRGAVLVP
jgi:hypothetical protein